MDIKRNIESIQAHLAGSQARLIAVSKTHPAESIREAYDAGHRMFGENKVQEMLAKQPALPADIEWHLIGHLQTNKVKQVVPNVALIHSVDSEKLLAEIDKQGAKIGRVIPCLLQVHIAKEETKFGFDAPELMTLAQQGQINRYKNVAVRGLMGMATLTDDKQKIRDEFRGLKKLFDQLKEASSGGVVMEELSMGMSSDYRIAIEEGSTLVRIGTAVFGSRPTHRSLQ
jgi:pyridoxal phosphate enzyme (YggS family)